MTVTWDRHTAPLLGAILLAAMPHLFSAPLWLVASVLVYSAAVITAPRLHRPPPPRALKWLLIFVGVAAIKMTYGHIVGRDPGISLFLMMAFLKLLEIRTERDRMVSLCMAYFLLAANLFFNQSLIMAAHMIVSVWVTTAVMIHIQDLKKRWRRHLGTSGALVLQALPVMVLLFFLFPRIQGTLWGVPQGASGTSGFTSRLSLGDVSAIVKNNEVAFRVNFEQEHPAPEERYWRGIVFWKFDGIAWERERPLPPQGEIGLRDLPTTYTVTLEPSGERWMFALDIPGAAAPDSRMDADYTLRAAAPITQRTAYSLTSYRRYQTPPAPTREIQRGLQIPEGNPRTTALGKQWAKTFSTTADIVSAAASLLTGGGFVYTLNPPLPTSDPVDQFLFETKRGYCEHFAASFALLMRAAGVPARVVGGYLGGETNPYGNYLIIRQSDAHAWVEILDGARGWVRIDPTAMVAPNRLVRSAAEALPAEELPTYLAMEGYGWAGSGLRTARLSWDAVNLQWHRWVASYAHQHQARLLSRAGITMKTWRETALLGVAAVVLTAIVIGIMALRPYLRPARRVDPAVKSYNAFCRKLARAGLPPKAPHDGPVRYARRVARRRPDLADAVHAITHSYVQYRYGKTAAPGDVEVLSRRVRRFRPAKRPARSPSNDPLRGISR